MQHVLAHLLSSAPKSAEIALQDLAACVRQLLLQFCGTTHRKPNRLIFYRDGVSDGQFPEVMRSEVPQVIAACRSLEEYYSPPVSDPFLSHSSIDHVQLHAPPLWRPGFLICWEERSHPSH